MKEHSLTPINNPQNSRQFRLNCFYFHESGTGAVLVSTRRNSKTEDVEIAISTRLRDSPRGAIPTLYTSLVTNGS